MHSVGGSLAVESMAGLAWNQWQASRGIGGRLAMESVAGLAGNTQTAAFECDINWSMQHIEQSVLPVFDILTSF